MRAKVYAMGRRLPLLLALLGTALLLAGCPKSSGGGY